jgi:hypothetical protein
VFTAPAIVKATACVESSTLLKRRRKRRSLMNFPSPDKAKKYALLAAAMSARAKSYLAQADAIMFDDVRQAEEKAIEVGRLLDLADDYARISIEFDNVSKEANKILVVPAISGIKGP